jgi:thiol-disulfide isomerase/thioredoxin
MKQKKRILSIIAVITIFLLLNISGLAFQQVQNNDTIDIIQNEQSGYWKITVDITNLEDTDYRGNLKIYMVEPTSRWDTNDNEPYHFGFLDFAFDGKIDISDTFTKNIFWNPSWDQSWDVDEDNIMAIAVLFNEDSEIRHSIPDTQERQFDAYFADAAAGATADTSGYNKVTDDFTHTVFVEKATATWCPPCAIASKELYNIYSSGDFPFYYVSMITDVNTVANNRMSNDFKVYYVPTMYFDGGHHVQVGPSESTSRSLIQASGMRDVPQLNLSVSLVWDVDTTPPSINITKPDKGLYLANEKIRDMGQTIIIGTVDVEVEASSELSGIDKVEFYVNGQFRSEDRFYPYRFRNWKERGIFGSYTLKAVAYDNAGNINMDEIQVLRFF